MSCSYSNEVSVIVTFFITAPLSSILTLVLTLLFVYVYIKRSGLTRKVPVKPVERDVEHDSYEEIQGPYVSSFIGVGKGGSRGAEAPPTSNQGAKPPSDLHSRLCIQ